MPALVYGETRINTSTNGYQQEPAVTALTDGGYVVAWSGYGVGDTSGIFTQRFDANGAKVGGETLINTTTAGEQKDAVITTLANGGYVVSWHNDVDGGDIFAQLYNANGAKVGSESRVNSSTAYEQDSPNITALNDGGYVVAWASYGQDSSGEWGTYLQRYNASGAKVGGETRINSTTAGAQDGPAITGLADGGYLAVWEGNGGGDAYGIFAQRFDAGGAKVGGETHINSTTTDLQSDPAITVLANGGYVVSWQSYPDDLDNDEDTQAPGDIYAQLYNASGAKVGGQTLVNSTTVGNQEEPNITAMSDGCYLVTWNGNGSGDSAGIFAQRYNASGAKVGGETRINTTTADNQEFSSVTALADGGYLIVWESYNQDGQYSGIYSQRFDASGNKLSGLTGDASANTLAWSGSGSVIIDAGAGNDSLSGGSANDHLNGGAGNDILNGRAGADRMIGGDGSDLYYVDNTGDVVNETNAVASTGGTDTVYSYLAAYSLGANLENLRLLATGAANGTGNGLNNLLYAGAGNNILNGSTGTDTASYAYATSAVSVSLASTTAQATGGSGSDTLLNIENLTGSNYHDKLTGNSAANTLSGGAGNDSLNGGAGADRMIGGDGSDIYYVDNTGDVVSETNSVASTGGADTVYSYLAAYSLGANLENLRLLASGAANGTGNSLNNLIYAGAGNNSLDGGAGTDTISYAYAASAVTTSLASTAAQATGGSGSDTLKNFENLTGSSYHDKLTGNSAANTLSGGAGNDILNGGAGADRLIGGDGSDLYYVDNTGDVVSETNSVASTGGVDTVYSYLAAYSLGANVENLRLLASGAANGTGNGLNNLIYAGAGNNILNGGTGTDTVSYAYAGSAVSASLASTAAQATGGSGSDTLLNIENLTGSNYHDTLTGNSAANTLSGGAGNDTLSGGAGNDLLIGGAGVDRLNGGSGADRFDFNALTEMGLGSLRDVIGDFKSSEGDKIDLSTLDANTATAANDAFSFIGSSAFSGTNAAGQLRFANGVLYGSTDADSAAEFEISLLGVTALSSTDFIA